MSLSCYLNFFELTSIVLLAASQSFALNPECNLTAGLCDDENFKRRREESLKKDFENVKNSMYFLIGANIFSQKNGSYDAYSELVTTFFGSLLSMLNDSYKLSRNVSKLEAYSFKFNKSFESLGSVESHDGETDLCKFKSILKQNLRLSFEWDGYESGLDYGLKELLKVLKKDDGKRVLWILSDARTIKGIEAIKMSKQNLKKLSQTNIYTVSLGSCPFGFYNKKSYEQIMHNLSTNGSHYSACLESWLDDFENYTEYGALECYETNSRNDLFIPLACVISVAVILLLGLLIFFLMRTNKCPIRRRRPGIPGPPPIPPLDTEVYVNVAYLKQKVKEFGLTYLSFCSLESHSGNQSHPNFTLETKDVQRLIKTMDEKGYKLSEFSISNNSYKVCKKQLNLLLGEGFEVSETGYQSQVDVLVLRDDMWLVAALLLKTTFKDIQLRAKTSLEELLTILNDCFGCNS